MLIYANHLNFEGVGAEEAIFRGIGVWLKEQLGFGLHPVQLREDGEHRGRHEKLGSWLRIYATDEEPPQMYSWVLKVNDNTVRGRQWITELGLKIQNGKYYLSCVLKTEEHSAMVDDPVIPSQPRVVRYIVSNVESEKQARFVFESVGTSVKNIGPDLDSYRALLIDIERRERPYPIVLVSPDHDGRYRVNPLHLQKMLLGLAQVVQIDKVFDSYEMAEVLGNHWSAWDGAVNLVSVPAPNGFIRGHIFRADEIDSWGENQYSRVSILLKWVTHNTNVPQSRHRVRVEGVMQLALRRKIQLVRARTSIMNEEQLRNELDSVWQLADEQAEQVAQLEQNVLQLEEDNETLQFSKMEIEERLGDEIRGKDYEISSLKIQLGGNYKQQQYTDVTPLIDLLVKPGQPSPEEIGRAHV